MAKEKKSLCDKAIDALTDRDEKEAAAKAAADAKARAEAAKKATEARAKLAAEKAAATRAPADKAAAEKAAAAKAAVQKAAAEKAAAEKAAKVKAAQEKLAAAKAAAAPRKGIVTTRSLRIRADHNTKAEVVAGLVNGDEVMVLSTWSDGKNTWAKLDKGWAAMVYNGETYIKIA
jgi:ATPase subunit of ABC transporter with duplicated ATPase domains